MPKTRLINEIQKISQFFTSLIRKENIDWNTFLTEIKNLVGVICVNQKNYYVDERDSYFKEIRFLLSALKLRGLNADATVNGLISSIENIVGTLPELNTWTDTVLSVPEVKKNILENSTFHSTRTDTDFFLSYSDGAHESSKHRVQIDHAQSESGIRKRMSELIEAMNRDPAFCEKCNKHPQKNRYFRISDEGHVLETAEFGNDYCYNSDNLWTMNSGDNHEKSNMAPADYFNGNPIYVSFLKSVGPISMEGIIYTTKDNQPLALAAKNWLHENYPDKIKRLRDTAESTELLKRITTILGDPEVDASVKLEIQGQLRIMEKLHTDFLAQQHNKLVEAKGNGSLAVSTMISSNNLNNSEALKDGPSSDMLFVPGSAASHFHGIESSDSELSEHSSDVEKAVAKESVRAKTGTLFSLIGQQSQEVAAARKRQRTASNQDPPPPSLGREAKN